MDSRDAKIITSKAPATAPVVGIICFFDDAPSMTEQLARIFPRLEFIHSETGLPVKIRYVFTNRVEDFLKYPQFTHPDEVDPFLVVLMDEQHDPKDDPSDGGKLTRTLVQGTRLYPDLSRFGTVPGGYGGKVVMYSTNTIYSAPGELETDISTSHQAHLLKKIGVPGIMAQGFQKNPMIETIAPMLNQVLASHQISVTVAPWEVKEKNRSDLHVIPGLNRRAELKPRNKLSDKRKFNSTSSLLKRAPTTPSQESPFSASSPAAAAAALAATASPYSAPALFFGQPTMTRQTSAPAGLSKLLDDEPVLTAVPEKKIQVSPSSSRSPTATTPTTEESPLSRSSTATTPTIEDSQISETCSPSSLVKSPSTTADALSELVIDRRSPVSPVSPNSASPSSTSPVNPAAPKGGVGKSRFTQFKNKSSLTDLNPSPTAPDSPPTLSPTKTIVSTH